MIEKNAQSLIVTENQEYQLHIAEINDDLPKDFFYQTYSSAFMEVGKIIEENERKKDLQESANNIIAFCGERGQGKSSAMLSFSKLLKNIKDAECYFDKEAKNISDNQFFVLQRIDPTELEKSHSILSVIIARIFFEFKQILEKSEMHSTAHQHSLIKCFNRCFHDVGIIKDEHRREPIEYEYEDDIDNLSQLSDAANMKKDFYDLVEGFLYYKFGGIQKKYLVVQIDDTDLNIRRSYEIVEDIRKYFMMPKVLILMATNITLLSQAIDQDFRKKFKISFETQGIMANDTYKMTSQYINKLLPGSRRINLPKISSADLESTENEIALTYQKQTRGGQVVSILNYTDQKGRPIEELQELVLRFIYEKTGLVFVKTVDTIHNIIPSNTRSLANFLSMLNSLPDIKGDLNDINEMFSFPMNSDGKGSVRTDLVDQRIHNLKAFEEYFVNIWAKENLENKYCMWFNEWLTLPYDEKNANFINYIASIINTSTINNSEMLERPIGRFSQKTVRGIVREPNDYSLRSVLYWIESLEQTGDSLIRILAFAVQTIYSIMLNKWFCNHIKNETFDFKGIDIVDYVGNTFTQYFIKLIPSINKSEDGWSIDYRVRVNPEELVSKFFGKSNSKYVSNSFVSSFFGSIPTKTSRSSYYLYTFNISAFIQRFLEPEAYLKEFEKWNLNLTTGGKEKSTGKESKTELIELNNTSGFKKVQMFCFILTTNLDIVSALLRMRIRTVRMHPSADCIRNAIENLQKEVSSWTYLPIWRYDLTALLEVLDSAKGFVDYILSLQPYEDNDKTKLRYSLNLLFNVAPDIDMASLVLNLNKITDIMYSIQDNFPVIDLTLEISELERIIENAKNAKKSWSAKTCDTYRQTLNRMSNSAKAKCVRFIND